MNNRTLSAGGFGAALFLALGALPGAGAVAQVGDISNVTYPGWIPSDRVDPTITVQVTCDPVTDLWSYEYTVANGPAAEQDILEFKLRFDGPQTFDQIESTPPPGWWALLSPGGAIPGATFRGEQPGELRDVSNPSPDQIPPASSLSGFVITSPFSPGQARTYVQGYAPVPFIKEAFGGDEEFIVPHDTTNSQRGFTIAPSGPIRPCALPFDAFDIERARVELDEKQSGEDRFEVRGRFELGAGNNGIDVLTEDVTVMFDGLSQIISAGSFFRDDDDEGFQFDGAPGSITRIDIRDDGEFRVEGRDLDMSGIDLSTPVRFSFQIGDDLGDTAILFDDEGRFRR